MGKEVDKYSVQAKVLSLLSNIGDPGSHHKTISQLGSEDEPISN